MRILDRYILRQMAWPFVLGLGIFTFLLIVPELMRYAEQYISKGVSLWIVGRLVITLFPYALALTIPMSLLLALLVAFGRLSADREFVAMQACGVSLSRLFRPVALASVASCLATAYVYMVLIPVGNQTFREITFNIVASSAENEVKPRVFFDGFPNVVLYARELPSSGGWDGVFIADDRAGEGSSVYLARHGRAVVNRSTKTVEMVLEDWTRHEVDPTGQYRVYRGETAVLSLSPEGMFPAGGISKGLREMTVPELQAQIASVRASGASPHNEIFELHKRFAIPAACLVFGLIGLALGATNRRDAKLASFVVGVGVIFAYYLLLWFGQSLVTGTACPFVAGRMAGEPRAGHSRSDALQVARPRRRPAHLRSHTGQRSGSASRTGRRRWHMSRCPSESSTATSPSPTFACWVSRPSRSSACSTCPPSSSSRRRSSGALAPGRCSARS